MKNEDFQILINKLLVITETKETHEGLRSLLLEVIKELQTQREKIFSLREAAAVKAYDAIYARGGWKSDGQAAAAAIRLIDPFDI